MGTMMLGLVLFAATGSLDTGTFYVAKNGSDDPRNGSQLRPWATITYAVAQAPDGSTILVRPGTYQGRVRLERKFVKGIVVRSELPYRAVLRSHQQVVFCYACEGITLEGFDIAHDGDGAGAIVVQIDGGGGTGARNVVIRNNVLHDSFNNDVLKINNGARNVLVQGNVFYNQAGSDEHIDINSVEHVAVEDNVFFNDFAGSQRPLPAQTASFVVIKDSNDDDDGILGSRDVAIRRNVFLGWQGNRAFGFILVGEDGKPYYEAKDVMVENNLLLGDASADMRSPFGVKGCQGTVFRNNTVIGDLPGSAFAARINREGQNKPGDQIAFYNNVWADPTGTMGDLTDTLRGDVGAFVLSHNLYWNGGGAIPFGTDDAVNYTADRGRVVADPGLAAPRGIAAPRWVADKGTFADGSRSIDDVRRSLVDRFARPSAGSALVDRADPGNAPTDDIRGEKRGRAPDIGAFEVDDKPVRAAATQARSTGRRR